MIKMNQMREYSFVYPKEPETEQEQTEVLCIFHPVTGQELDLKSMTYRTMLQFLQEDPSQAFSSRVRPSTQPYLKNSEQCKEWSLTKRRYIQSATSTGSNGQFHNTQSNTLQQTNRWMSFISRHGSVDG